MYKSAVSMRCQDGHNMDFSIVIGGPIWMVYHGISRLGQGHVEAFQVCLIWGRKNLRGDQQLSPIYLAVYIYYSYTYVYTCIYLFIESILEKMDGTVTFQYF